MTNKERIRTSPILAFSLARLYYYGSEVFKELFIEIEIANRKENVSLFSSGIYFGNAKEKLFQYDNEGTILFNSQMPYFGKIKVQLYNGKAKEFASYDEFLDKITSK